MPSILGEFTKLCSLPCAWYCQATWVDNDVAHARNHNGRCQLTCAGPRAFTHFRAQLWSFPPTLNVGDVARIKVWSSFSRLSLASWHRLLPGDSFFFFFLFFLPPLRLSSLESTSLTAQLGRQTLWWVLCNSKLRVATVKFATTARLCRTFSCGRNKSFCGEAFCAAAESTNMYTATDPKSNATRRNLQQGFMLALKPSLIFLG
ncbi:uncharacterized protein IWZ02DRAFT_155691 [Phyllosticta citriasiana]|uniref:uncharacterized protein n=1 Tax=Phyllosticta citriasiana TaxID=595635 RepID=UPI0030FDE4DF